MKIKPLPIEELFHRLDNKDRMSHLDKEEAPYRQTICISVMEDGQNRYNMGNSYDGREIFGFTSKSFSKYSFSSLKLMRSIDASSMRESPGYFSSISLSRP